jgi:uncharacterized protein (TIGR00251 family)
MTDLPYRLDECGSARLTVRLTPRARRDELGGIVDAGGGRVALSVRLAAPPVDGAANRALIAFLAKRLDIPKSSIVIASGETSRVKTVIIGNVTEAALRRLV